jgi:hypothetical protein
MRKVMKTERNWNQMEKHITYEQHIKFPHKYKYSKGTKKPCELIP